MDSRPFHPSEVLAQRSMYAKVEKSLIILSHSELTRALGRAPRAKDPKLHTIKLALDQSKSPETFYVFRDESAPFRRLTLGTCLGESMQEFRMSDESHVHAKQGLHTLLATRDLRVVESGEDILVNHSQLNTVESYVAKLVAKPGAEAPAGAAAAAAAGSKDRDPDQMSTEQDEGDEGGGAQSSDDEAGDDEGEDDGDSGAEPLHKGSLALPAAVARAQVMHAKPSSVASVATPRLTRKGASSFLERTGSSKSVVEGGHSSKHAGSEKDASSLFGEGFENLPQADKVQAIFKKIQVRDILEGKKKGRQIRHADNNARKMSVQMQDMVLTHLKHCRHAEVLAPSAIFKATDSERDTAIAGLQDVVSEWPSQLMLNVWKLHRHREQKAVLSCSDDERFIGYLRSTKPWTLESEKEKGFDMSIPKLHQIDGVKCQAKGALFQEAVMDLMCAAVGKGEAFMPRVASMAQSLLSWMGTQLQDDLDDVYVKVALEIKEPIQVSLRALGSQNGMKLKTCVSSGNSLLLPFFFFFSETNDKKQTKRVG